MSSGHEEFQGLWLNPTTRLNRVKKGLAIFDSTREKNGKVNLVRFKQNIRSHKRYHEILAAYDGDPPKELSAEEKSKFTQIKNLKNELEAEDQHDLNKVTRLRSICEDAIKRYEEEKKLEVSPKEEEEKDEKLPKKKKAGFDPSAGADHEMKGSGTLDDEYFETLHREKNEIKLEVNDDDDNEFTTAPAKISAIQQWQATLNTTKPPIQQLQDFHKEFDKTFKIIEKKRNKIRDPFAPFSSFFMLIECIASFLGLISPKGKNTVFEVKNVLSEPLPEKETEKKEDSLSTLSSRFHPSAR